MLATSSVSVVDISDGVGIASSIIDYAVHTSGTTPPGNVITDGSGNPILSNDGKPLTDGSWNTTLPTIPEGYYLWTRTRLVRTDGSFDMVYNVSRSGTDGEDGATGATISTSKEQWYLSNSSS